MGKIRRTIWLLRVFLPQMIIRYGPYLQTGDYEISIVQGIYAQRTDVKIGPLTKGWTFHEHSRIIILAKNILSLLFGRRVQVINGAQKFSGDVIKFHYTFSYVKIFDLTNRQVLTFYEDDHHRETVQWNKKRLGEYFSVPETFDRIDGGLVDGYIDEQESSSSEKFQALLLFMERYYKKVIEDNSYDVRDIVRDFSGMTDPCIQLLCDVIPEGEIYRLPKLMLHGDCWRSNLLTDGKRLIFIDYETVNTYSFLYDIFKFLYGEAFYNKDHELLDAYFDGYFDGHFQRFFDLFGLTYEKKSRKVYFLIFLMELYTQKSMGKPSEDKRDMHDRIKYFLKHYYQE